MILRKIDLSDFDPLVESSTIDPEEVEKALRELRETECFPIVNRGDVWYNRLSSSERSQLENWYQEWLDVTETFKKPNKPSFI